jgi:hypothetical protein
VEVLADDEGELKLGFEFCQLTRMGTIECASGQIALPQCAFLNALPELRVNS